MKTAITYGTFDTLHWGHIEILRRAKEAAEELAEIGEPVRLVVGISDDDFNAEKGKQAYHTFEEREKFVQAIRYVDETFPEHSWGQKPDDFKKYNADILVMGEDWKDRPEFQEVKHLIKAKFLPRTKLISSTEIRNIVSKAGK
ncbi:MAG: adenylyltransferase/cytidyltransferase family protein [Candidatus Ancillula sp.]|jgi:glycerol-3-phosphate cytidylyltransferase|nr:adenylyltransferase/cytidyltransferase family protein [Candidatus Ancillula sp.]